MVQIHYFYLNQQSGSVKRIHFIAIGGAAMHNLAIALKKKGLDISGSDDEIFDPSLSRLREHGLLPEAWGWFPEKIGPEINAVILGMHARKDNRELKRAQELQIPVYSYPEFLYMQTRNKKRAVIAGSHGKTSITAMVLHVLRTTGKKFDYMVGSQIDGFDTMVGLDAESTIAVFEGDEYLSSPLDLRPKFMHYKPHIALISGIAWDHINVFPTWEGYVDQFRQLIAGMDARGKLVYYVGDEVLAGLTGEPGVSCQCLPYREHASRQHEGGIVLLHEGQEIPIRIFGHHNLQNISGAKEVCRQLGISDDEFYRAIATFGGTARRLQHLGDVGTCSIYLDFAHSPSKVKATVEAVRSRFPGRRLVALFELHTFSSLSKDFLPQYRHTLDAADEAVVFFSEEVVRHKKLEAFTPEDVERSFGSRSVKALDNPGKLQEWLSNAPANNTVILLMSSGNLGGIDFRGVLGVDG